MPEAPVKLYVERLLKDSRSLAKQLALLSGPTKEKALHAMADRLVADEATVLEANAKDVDAVGKSFEGEAKRDRIKAAVERVRLAKEDISLMSKRLRLIAELPDPVGTSTARWERPDGLQVSRVRIPLGVIGVISELSPLVTVESLALCLKSGNLCVFRGASEWRWTNKALESVLQMAAEQSGLPRNVWIFVERPEKEIALEIIRSGRHLDAIVPRGGMGLRNVVVEQSKVPVLCHQGGLTCLYIDGETDVPMAQNLVINSKAQSVVAPNALDTLLVHQGIGRQFLPPLINRLLNEFKIEVRGCPKTVALMGQMAMTGHTAIVPATEADWRTQFLGPVLAIKMVEKFDEVLEHQMAYGPCLTAGIATSSYHSAMRFSHEVDAGAVLVNASLRLNAGECYGMGPDIGLSAARLHAKGPIGLEQLTCEKYVVFGTGQLRLPHPVPETYFDAIMLKRP